MDLGGEVRRLSMSMLTPGVLQHPGLSGFCRRGKEVESAMCRIFMLLVIPKQFDLLSACRNREGGGAWQTCSAC